MTPQQPSSRRDGEGRTPKSTANGVASGRGAARTSRPAAGLNGAVNSRPGGSRPGQARPSQNRSSQNRPAQHRLQAGFRQQSGRRRKRSWRFPLANSKRRLNILALCMMLALGLCVARALQLQVLDSRAYAAKAALQLQRTQVLVPVRGQIMDRNGTVLATSEPAVMVIADPYMIATNGVDPKVTMGKGQRAAAAAAPGVISTVLAKYLGGKPEDYTASLTAKVKGKPDQLSQYEIIKKKVPAWTYAQLAAELAKGGRVDGYKVDAWYGIFKADDPIRVYPSGDVAANVVGFMHSDGTPGGGLELSLDSQLKGIPGRESYESSAYGRIPLANSTLTPAVNGASYTTTLDSAMQLFAQNALAKQVQATGAKSGSAIVMNVKTGEILAAATAPSFNANELNKAKTENMGNRLATNPYEPGSVEKVLTMAALADQGLVTPDTKVVVPPQIKSGSGYVKDAEDHGTWYLTARGVIAESSNIGMIELARLMDKAKLAEYLQSFGYGKTTGNKMPGEAAGTLPPATMPDYTRDQIAFGQGLSVTALQITAAVAAIANGGVYNQPTLLKSAVDGNGKPIALPTPQSHRVVSQKAADDVLDMMEAVITQVGSGKRQIANYRMAGKSGTAQAVVNGKYNGYVASFVGVAPVEDPQIVVYVVLDHPVNGHQGSQVALPVVQELMQLALPRYGVKPSTTEPRKETIFWQK